MEFLLLRESQTQWTSVCFVSGSGARIFYDVKVTVHTMEFTQVSLHGRDESAHRVGEMNEAIF